MTIDDRLLKIRQVRELVSFGVSAIWRRVKAQTFPAPIKTGGGTFWKASDVQAYIQAQGVKSNEGLQDTVKP